MSKPFSLSETEWERLLTPFSETAPTGTYLLYEGTYDKIQAARRQDDATLPQGVWQIKLKQAEWDTVRDLCIDALCTRSKDLQIAVWLLEAWLRLHDYAGLKQGLKLLIQLSETFWDTLFPPVDEQGDIELRVSPFEWMNEKMKVPLGSVFITAPVTEDALPYTFIDREAAWLLENTPTQKQDADAQGKPTRAKFLTSVTLTPRTFYETLLADLQESIELTNELSTLLDELCGKHAPSLVRFRQILLDIQQVITQIIKDKPGEATVAEEVSGDSNNTASPNGIVVTGTGRIRNRDEAYRRLAEAADYLLETEPHSPVPYLIKRAVTWGNMSLTELLLEIVNDQRDLAAIYSLLGVKFDKG